MKKIVALLVSALSLTLIVPASAVEQKSLVIIDTAITADYSKNIIQEVCIVGNWSCPNGAAFMEGIGSAQISGKDLTIKNIDHGQQVTSVAINQDPNVKVIFIRISSINRYRDGSTALHTDGTMLGKALDWVSNNHSKYNIGAVSISQSRINFAKGSCPTDSKLESEVLELKQYNIPVLVGVGNWGKVDHTGFPACVTNVIGVGAVDFYGTPFWFTHHGIGVDFYSVGRYELNSPSLGKVTVLGTSMSTPALAVRWINTFSGSYDEQIFSAVSLSEKKIEKITKYEMRVIK